MDIAILAINLRNGGGQTHLINLLSALQDLYPNERYLVYTNSKLSEKICEHQNIQIKKISYIFDRPLLSVIWENIFLSRDLNKNNIKLLFIPGGRYARCSIPVVSMFRNALPFSKENIKLYPLLQRLKFHLLRRVQIQMFKRSQKVIALNSFGQDIIKKYVNNAECIQVIPHGISKQIRKKKIAVQTLKRSNEIRVLYVSSYEPYKHHDKVIIELSKICNDGYSVRGVFVGAIPDAALDKVRFASGSFCERLKIEWFSEVSQSELISKFYEEADIAIFASSCENLPNIVLEKMKAGIPLFFHRVRPTMDLVSSNDLSFDIFSSGDLSSVIKRSLDDPSLILKNVTENYRLAKKYDWETTARETRKTLLSCIERVSN
jgi:glycosyltransferase involved in cell wall biosynthesis